MSDKLKELTDRLYNEGLEKGKTEGEKILSDARAEAEKILSAARDEAEAIKSKAVSDSEALKAKTASDLRTAAEQCLQAAKKDLENILVGAMSDCDFLSDGDFLKRMVESVAGSFSASESKDLSIILPEKLKTELEPWVAGELKKRLGEGISAGFSKKVSGGFTIGPKDGSYYISLTEETFRELIASYIRPVTRKLLFGE